MKKLFVLAMVVALLPCKAQAEWIAKPGVPDIDVGAGEETCWLAAAANQLAAAGWGDAGTIYYHMVSHYGNKGGFELIAAKWWLNTYGLNPDSSYFKRTVTYTDFHVHNVSGRYYPGAQADDWLATGATKKDYDHLLKELKDCQYINVAWEPLSGSGHVMTLVGGDTSDTTGGKSRWHDSNGDRSDPPGDDDDYSNNFIGGTSLADWALVSLDYGSYRARYATVLCPGLSKPLDAMMNYDVAYYPEYLNEAFSTKFREAGVQRSEIDMRPDWGSDTEVTIGNEYVEGRQKEIYLLVDYASAQATTPEITIEDDQGNKATLVEAKSTASKTQYLWHFSFPGYQPEYEKIIFPNSDYRTLEKSVIEWDVSTICIPEPVSIAFMGAALAGVVAGRRSRRGREGSAPRA